MEGETGNRKQETGNRKQEEKELDTGCCRLGRFGVRRFRVALTEAF